MYRFPAPHPANEVGLKLDWRTLCGMTHLRSLELPELGPTCGDFIKPRSLVIRVFGLPEGVAARENLVKDGQLTLAARLSGRYPTGKPVSEWTGPMTSRRARSKFSS